MRAGAGEPADACPPSAVLTPLPSQWLGRRFLTKFSQWVALRGCSADTVADELLKILHYYSAPSLSLLPPCPAPGLRGPWLSLRNARRPPARRRPPLPHTPPRASPAEVAAGRGGGVPPRPGDSCCWVPDPTPAGLRGLLWVCGCAGSLKTWLECRLTSGDTSEACPLQMMSGPRRFSPCRRSDRAPPSSCCLSRGSRAGSSVTPASNQIWLLQEQNRTLSCCPSLGPGVPGGAWRGRAWGGPAPESGGQRRGSLGHSEPPGHPPHCRASTGHPRKGH